MVKPWYEEGEIRHRAKFQPASSPAPPSPQKIVIYTPFEWYVQMECQNKLRNFSDDKESKENALLCKLRHIHKVVLKSTDPELLGFLTQMEIPPEIYGMQVAQYNDG